MKIINDWPSLNELNILVADPPVLANGDSLYYNFYDYHYESVSVGLSIYLPELDKFYVSIMLFYYRLTLLAEDNFYEDD
jgi:hypothetical protein